MANFSALKTAIQNAIKQNGNEEITGDVLQQILLSIVSTMGDGAINTIEQNLSNETTNRQGADTQLQNAINAIKANIDNGYMYAGIATPSTTPVSGKVFYIATAAGTYTNFGGQVLTQGINILRFNGSAWSSQQLIGIDDEPTAGSNNIVKSGGVQKDVFNLSPYSIEYGYLKFISNTNIPFVQDSSNSWVTTEYLKADDIDIIELNLRGYVQANTVSTITFYDKNKNTVSSIHATSSNPYVVFTKNDYIVPSGAVYVRFSFNRISNGNKLIVKAKSSVFELKEEFNEFNEEFNKLVGSSDIREHVYSLTKGTHYQNANTIGIYQQAGTKIKIKAECTNDCVRCYSILDNGVTGSVYSESYLIGKEYVVTLPVNINTIGLRAIGKSILNDGEVTLYVWTNVGDNGLIKDLPEQININADINTPVLSQRTILLEDCFLYNAYINANNGGAIYTNDNWATTDYIYIKGISCLFVCLTQWNGNPVGIAFYDKDKNIIVVDNFSWTNLGLSKVDIPASSWYFRATFNVNTTAKQFIIIPPYSANAEGSFDHKISLSDAFIYAEGKRIVSADLSSLQSYDCNVVYFVVEGGKGRLKFNLKSEAGGILAGIIKGGTFIRKIESWNSLPLGEKYISLEGLEKRPYIVYVNYYSPNSPLLDNPYYTEFLYETENFQRELRTFSSVRKPLSFNNKSIVIIGDSIAKGVVDNPSGDYFNWASLVFDGANISNIAVPGASFHTTDTTFKILTQLQNAPKDAEYYVVFGGANDYMHAVGYEESEDDIIEFIDYLNEQTNGKVIWISPIENAKSFYASMADGKREFISNYGKKMFNTICSRDTKDRFSFIYGCNFGFPSYEDDSELKSTFFVDGIHPTIYGYKELLVRGLRNALL